MSSKSKKQRPVSTAAISLPQVYDASTLASQAQFSPKADLFALLSLAVDKHRLRVFDTTTGSILAEHIVDAARVTSITWVLVDLTSDGGRVDRSPTKKRKKTAGDVSDVPQAKAQLVSLGLSNGTLLLFSPTHARVLRTLAHPSSLAAVLAISAGTQPFHIWSSSADGAVRLWNAARNELLGSWTNDGGIPYSALAPRPGQNLDSQTELLVANHAMRVLSIPTSTASAFESVKPDQLFSFTGHASTVTSTQWDASEPSRFISVAESDRVISLWRVPEPPSKQGAMIANVPLDAFARHATLSSVGTPMLLTVSASGKVALFDLPSRSKAKSKVASLCPRSTISAPSKGADQDAPVVAAAFVPQQHGRVQVARLKSGVKPVFEVVNVLDEAGEFVPQVLLSKDVSSGLATATDGGPSMSQKRYVEAPNLAVRSGLEPDQEAALDDMTAKGLDGDLDVDLTELSLGQRLAALSGDADITPAHAGGSSAEDAASSHKISTSRRKKKTRADREGGTDHLPVPAHSLSRTLVQALHSADTRLLETCLLHSDERLVLNTVRRLPPQLAVPLLTACVERLGRGAGANTGKGGGGGASAQRGTGLVKWVRAVLVVHTAHLMTIPDLVGRLSGLHTTLTARLALRDPLLALSGRLDLVLSQIEMRASSGPAPIAPDSKAAGRKRENREPVKYVEGESESDEDEEGDEDEMEVEKDDEAGSVEDVELGMDSGSDESQGVSGSDEENAESSKDEGSDEGPRLNGFIDDEAEEWSEEDSEE